MATAISTAEKLTEILLKENTNCNCREMPHDVNPPCRARKDSKVLAVRIMKVLEADGWVAPPEPFTPPKGYIITTEDERDRLPAGYWLFDDHDDVMVREKEGWEDVRDPSTCVVVLPATVVKVPDE